jgi:hypothetical protein
MAAGKSVGEQVDDDAKDLKKVEGQKAMRILEGFVWLLYIALVLCLIGLGGAKAENFGEWMLVPGITAG